MDHVLSLLVLIILFLVQMFSASAKKVRLRKNPFTLRMTIWGFPVVKLHAAVLVTSIEPVAFCHPFCPGCNVSVLPALPKYCIHDISGSVSHGFWELNLKLCAPFCFISPMVSISIIFILLELMLSPQAFMYTGCYPCLQNSNCFPKINSHYHCAFYDAFPHLCIWPLLRVSIFFFSDLQVEFVKRETVSSFRFWSF